MTTRESTTNKKFHKRDSGPKCRMVAIDFDGTLLSPLGVVTDRTRTAIHKALSAGLLICFATGRTWPESEKVLDAVGHREAAVFAGGAVVVDLRNQVILHRAIMQPALAARVCAFFESLNLAAMALQDASQTGLDYLISQNLEMDVGTVRWMEMHKMKVHRVKDLADHPHSHTLRVGVVAERSKVALALAGLAATFGDEIVYHGIGVIGQDVDVLEVFDPAVNKWQGILHVARHHGINPGEIIAVGDDLNDLPMIRQAGLGVAMGNSHPQVVAAAGRVIGRNNEDGLAEFLEELARECG